MFDTERMTARIWNELGREYGVQNLSSLMPETMGANHERIRGIFRRRVGREFPFETFLRRTRERADEIVAREGIPVKPGLFELLDFLKKGGYTIAAASSTERTRVLRYFRIAGVIGYFQAVICGDMVRKSKPDPDIYLAAAKATGTAPEECMALEDSPNGCLSASRAGMKAVMVPDLVRPDKKLHSILSACVPTLRDVIPLLSGEAATGPRPAEAVPEGNGKEAGS